MVAVKSSTTGHNRTTSKHSIKAVDIGEIDSSPYSSLGAPSLPRAIATDDMARPYHVDLATMTMPNPKPKRSFVPSGLANMLPGRRGSKDSRKSFGLRKSSSTASSNRPFSIISTSTVTDSNRALEDDYVPIPPPPAPLVSPELPPPPPPPPLPTPAPNPLSLPAAIQPDPLALPHQENPNLAAVRAPLHLNLSRQGSTSSRGSGRARPALHSPAQQSPIDRHWSVEFEGRMRTLSQNKLAHVKQKEAKYFGDEAV